jgi:parallel beta-helix repeat protein
MSKKLLLLMLLALLIGTLNLASRVEKAKANGTIYIRADGSIDPTTAPISSIDNVTYTLTGNITSDADGIVVERSNIVIDGAGYTLQGTGAWGSGICLSGRSNVTVKNTNIKDFCSGIWLEQSHYNSIVGNVFVNSGIVIPSWTEADSYGNVVVDNLVNGKPLVYLEGVSDVVVEDAGQVTLVNCNRIKVENLNLSNTTRGVQLWRTNNTKIVGNTIINNSVGGIGFWESSNNSISGNSITNNGYDGIYLGSSNYNNITENDITNDRSAGVYFYSSNYNSISGNNIANNGRGIGFWGSEYNIISGNNIKANKWEGIYGSANNVFYHNNFNNVNQASVFTLGDANTWDDGYPSGGNYWSDYTGVDLYSDPYQNETGSDSIGDTPYIINDNNRDRYPLMTPSEQAPPTPQVQVGVNVGDWIKIEYAISGWPAGTPSPKWLKVEFLSIVRTTATVRVTMHMSDGTEQNATVPVDIVTGGGGAFGLSGFAIPANLTVGDTIFMSGYGNVTIADETTRAYAGASRTVVYTSFSQYGTQLTYYWDKQTGVMVEASTTSGTVTGTGKATETNLWQAAPFGLPIEPTYLILAALVIIIVVGATAFIVRRKKKPPEVESPQI